MSTAPPRWIMHLDMDAFYAAVEQRDNPDLRGLPVVVGAQPGGRGVVATCSYEARRFGIRSAMPINEAYRRCPDAVYLRPRMTHYQDVARQVRAVLETHAPVVEPISIDEAFLDISGLGRLIGPPETIGRQIKDAIRASVGLTASVGIGPNRLVAKIASDFRKPDGLVVVAPDEVLDFLGPQPVNILRGVGTRTLPILERMGRRTVADLRRLSLTQLQAQLGPRTAVNLYQQARGIASDQVGDHGPRQSLSKETTFGQDVTDSRLLKDTLRDLATTVAAAARQEGIAGRTMILKIRFAGFETHTRQRRLDYRTNEARTLFATAWALYEADQWAGRPVRLIGLGMADLGTPDPIQPDLFDGGAERPSDSTRNRRLTATIDRIQARFGSGALRQGMSTDQRESGDDRSGSKPSGSIKLTIGRNM
jgi:DNA polymerase-4